MANLTDSDRKLLAMSWQCFKAMPEIDYEKLQEEGGYKTKASANAVWCALKKKLLGPDPDKTTPSDRDLLVKAWQCFKTPPQVDYAKLQEVGNYKTKASANAVFCALKKKVLGPTASPVKGSGGGKKRKSVKAEDGEDEKPKKKRTKKTAEIEDGEGEIEKPKKKQTRKGKGKEGPKTEDDLATGFGDGEEANVPIKQEVIDDESVDAESSGTPHQDPDQVGDVDDEAISNNEDVDAGLLEGAKVFLEQSELDEEV